MKSQQDFSMRVAADLRWPSGTGINICQNEHLSRMPPGVDIKELPLRSRIGHPVSPFEIAARLSSVKRNADVFWNPGFIPSAWRVLPSVVTVHDLIHLHFYSAAHVKYYNYVFKPMYKRCSAIICVSEYTRHEFLAWSGMDPDVVHVVHGGVSDRFNADVDSKNLDFPYIFYPGNKRPYKNLERLMYAYAASKLPRLGIKLVMTGEPTPELDAVIYKLGVKSDVMLLGFVGDEEMPNLYRGAQFTVFVSLYEGFGLPILESMGVGTPVLTSNVSSMPEVAGHAAEIVDPYDIKSITRALDRLAVDDMHRKFLSVAGLERVKEFSWAKSSAKTWEIVRSVAASGHYNGF